MAAEQLFTDSDPDIKGTAHRFQELEERSDKIFKKYNAAMSIMNTRLNVMNDDLRFQLARNPIHHIESRLKRPYSSFEKLERYGKEVTLENLEKYILDIAGLRVICSYPDDVYHVVDLVERQDDLHIVRVKDYITSPKPNGYRSLHLITKVPVYFASNKEYVPVEIQFRTIAMDLWASLEHGLRYKAKGVIGDMYSYNELRDCSAIIEGVETRMQNLMHAMTKK